MYPILQIGRIGPGTFKVDPSLLLWRCLVEIYISFIHNLYQFKFGTIWDFFFIIIIEKSFADDGIQNKGDTSVIRNIILSELMVSLQCASLITIA